MADVLNQEDVDWLLDDVDNYDLEDCHRAIADGTHIFKEHNEYVKVPYRVFSDMLINLKKFKQLLESERAERIKEAMERKQLLESERAERIKETTEREQC